MKVLFVDDEEHLLEGLQRMLFHSASDWDIETATSGQAALELIRGEIAEPFDIVVSDMRMPGMDGATLLKHVHEEQPGIIRIILSGYSEEQSTIRASLLAHQILAKPCDADLLRSTIQRAWTTRSKITAPKILEAVGDITTLPTVPSVYSELKHALSDAEFGVEDVGAILERDPALCIKMLQFVNSSFFGRPVPITNIRQAVIHLGIDMVKNLVLTAEVFVGQANQKELGFDIDAFQTHAIRTATLARRILPCKSQADDLFLVGLIHDIGKLLMVAALPDKYQECRALAAQENISQTEAEKIVLDLTHAELGGYLLDLWGLPMPIVEAVINHHEPQRLLPDKNKFEIVDAIYVADRLLGGCPPDLNYLEELGVLDQMDTWTRLLGELD